MNEKFSGIPIDSDTTILLNSEMKFGLLDCVYQTWIYDGIKGSSLIFYKNDLQNILKENLETEIRQSNLLIDKTSKITYSDNNNGYVFFNFNFKL